MKLSVIVPAYNEEVTVAKLLKKLVKQKEVKEVVVVDDFSNDKTVQEIQKVKSKKIKLVRHTENKGKGFAIRTGLVEITGDYVLIQDADLEYDPEDIASMVEPVVKEKATVVYGSRFTGPRKNMFFWHMLGNRLLSLLVNVLYNTTISDMETCYKLLPTQLWKDLNLKENDFAIEPEVTCKVLNRKIFIYETPISYTGRTFEEGKKITWRDGLKAVFIILKYRFYDKTTG